MTKNSLWFRHDFDAKDDEKLLQLRERFGAEGYGIFWMILETMATNNGVNRVAIGGLSLGYGVAKERVQEIIDFCVEINLFVEADSRINSARLNGDLAWRKSLKEAGRSGAEKRWSTSQKNRVANGIGDKTREEKIREDTTVGFENEILKQLSRQGIENPKGYLARLKKETSLAAIKKAWGDWKRGVCVENPSQFYSRCVYWHEYRKEK